MRILACSLFRLRANAGPKALSATNIYNKKIR